MLPLTLTLALFSLISLNAFAQQDDAVIRTIDDQKGDSVTGDLPVYVGGWNALSAANIATTNIPLDPSLVFDGTWHNAAIGSGAPLQIQMSFVGNAVSVFFILPDSSNGFPGFYQNATFELDGKIADTFFHNSTLSNGFKYNTTVFSKTDLTNGKHQLNIIAPPYQGPKSTIAFQNLILFDFVAYATEDTSSSSSSTTSSGTTSSGTTSSSTTSTGTSSSSSNTATTTSPPPSSNNNQSNPASGASGTGAALPALVMSKLQVAIHVSVGLGMVVGMMLL